MAYTTINKHTDYFNTKLYTGNGSTNAQTGVGFQPDLTWIKRRNNTGDHLVADAVRGANKNIRPNTTAAESDDGAIHLNSFDSDGFTVGGTGTHSNGNGDTYASWNWKAGTTSGISTDNYSTITPTGYSFNATNGFSIVKYNGNGTAGAGVPHGLGVAPKMVIVKRTGSSGTGWYVYHKDIGAGNMVALNSTNAVSANSTVWNGWNTDATNFYLGTNTGVNDNGTAHIAYCFAEKTGYSKIGSYVGNGSSDGTFIYTGFKPAWILARASSRTGRVRIWDVKRRTFNVMDRMIDTTSSDAEITGATEYIDILSNGFKFRTSEGQSNGSGETNVYMAFGQSLVGSNNVPCTAR